MHWRSFDHAQGHINAPAMSIMPSWECAACTYVNNNAMGLACIMCHTERDKRRSSPRRSAEPIRWVSNKSSKFAGKKNAGEKRAESENDDDAFTQWKSNNNKLTSPTLSPH